MSAGARHDSSDLRALKARIDELTPPNKLRLAADLLEKQRAKLAYTIASQVVTELGAAMALEEPHR